MAGMDRGHELDLLPATCSGGDHNRTIRQVLEFLDQWLCNFEGKLELGLKHAESAGHAATASVEVSDLAIRKAHGQPMHVCGIRQRLGMAVGMDHHVFVGNVE